MTSTVTPPTSLVRVAPVTQRRVVASEWIKMRSLRSTTLTLLAAVIAMVALAWLVGWATNAHWTSMRPEERASFNPIDRSLAGVNLAQLAIGVLGVLLVTGEAGYLTLVGMLAVAFGFLIRSTAGGIATLFGLLLVLPGIGQLLPASWQSHTLPYLPSNAGSAFYSAQPDPTAVSPGAGLLVLCGWVVVALAAAALLVQHRDA